MCDRLKIFSSERPTKPGETPSMSSLIGSNFISRMRTDSVSFEEHVGPLSIKCAFHGRESYHLDGGTAVVDDSSYLLLNQGQRYASSIDHPTPVESFCVWFRPGFAEEVHASLTSASDRVMEHPEVKTGLPITFFDRVYRHDMTLSPLIFQLRAIVQTDRATPEWLDEQFYLLAERLLEVQRDIYREVAKLPAARASTRVELYRRLYRARDFIEANLEAPLSLNEIAGVACISPHHFLRTFQKTFRETPRQYQIRRRMERVRVLLRYTETSVTEICFSLGFESLGSFSWLFRKLHGISPTQYRLSYTGKSENSTFEEAASVSIH